MPDASPFRLDPGSGVPFYRQIIDQVVLAVADGRLKPGAQLPTVRQLAVDLSVNLNTVARAYKEMEIRGLVETQQGTGTFVAHRKPERRSAERRKALEQLVERFLALASARGFHPQECADAILERTGEAPRR
ncbi:MAG TPA: GntR family transcriptional regulator [Thermoanaerobaculia bacterium]|jgi:GntR family transcriptional regulator|nr:GntR family transcriptional regulator [Thermoanaerobaculia bacterium]HQR67154.1 GntR family transcriptional regulator [Thermoanaerobaculia bacterium]